MGTCLLDFIYLLYLRIWVRLSQYERTNELFNPYGLMAVNTTVDLHTHPYVSLSTILVYKFSIICIRYVHSGILRFILSSFGSMSCKYSSQRC